ncbi:hypothetical protein CC80DRAFT_494813 [Byssothecium circinans]|uniref:BTB domain-containing protein n=1 Tax=Byssothecium circinans TaxID=147558 RepID=A0A6A5TKL2_9PLEO|nr:hypothetical protein CC80DRAFT_494813 [Byssothecium circinans]
MSVQDAPNAAAGKKRRRPTFLSMGQDLVKITIGDQDAPQVFMVHQELICHHSGYFRAAFEGRFVESEEKCIHLPDVSERELRVYMHWLYAQASREHVERDSMHTDATKRWHANRVRASYASWVEDESKEFLMTERIPYMDLFLDLWTFGDKYDTPEFCNDIMTILMELEAFNRERSGQLDESLDIDKMYEQTTDKALFQVFIHRRYGLHWCPNPGDIEQVRKFPRRFLAEIVCVKSLCQELNTLFSILFYRTCNFHTHCNDQTEEHWCKEEQLRHGQFFASFLRACLEEARK